MLLCLALACIDTHSESLTFADPPDDVRFELRPVRACAVIADDSLYAPSRLVFLYKEDGVGVDAQAELTQYDASRLRCGNMDLHLLPDRDRTPVVMDFMPPSDPVTLRELRVYRLGTSWDPNDPFALAVPRHEPFRDYEFTVNLLLPPWSDDPSTIALP